MNLPKEMPPRAVQPATATDTGGLWCAVAVLVMSGLLLAACDRDSGGPPVAKLGGPIFGTFYEATLLGTYDDDRLARLEAGVRRVLEKVDRQMSTYREDSDLNRLNGAPVGEWVEIPDALYGVLKESVEIARATEGAFDPTVGGVVNLWSFGPESRPRQIPPPRLLDQVLLEVGYGALELDAQGPRARRRADFFVDLSGIAKGHAVDAVGAWLVSQGIESFLVNIGGDLTVRGRRPDGERWRVAIQVPETAADVARIVALEEQAFATSGDYHNYFEDEEGRRYSHLIDPADGLPIRHRTASVSVVAGSAIRADALATALMVMPPEPALAWAEARDVAVLLIERDGDRFRLRESSAFTRLTATRVR